MMEKQWLPHLDTSMIDSKYSKRISTYLIALEGWRRGLTLQFHKFDYSNNKIHYSLDYKGNKHIFHSSRGDLITDEAIHICNDKDLTKSYLSKANIPVPKGKKFSEITSDSSIIEYAETIGYPVVLKPTSEAGGRGVFSNVQSKIELKKVISYVRHNLKYKSVLLEEYIPGKDYRVFVFNGKVLGGLDRIAANIVGNGENSVSELIKQKNKVKKLSPHTARRPLKIDAEVKEMLLSKNYTLESIPEEGERIFLREKNNMSEGGDPIDITDQLTLHIKDIAIKAVNSIPGLIQGGVDVIVDNNDNVRAVLEINEQPGLGGHLFPVKGRARDIPKELIDFYFPETIDLEKSSLYFNFAKVLEPLKDNIINSVKVSPAQIGEIFAKKYIVSGTVQKVGYRKWIKSKATKQNLSGFAKNLKNGKVVVVVAGTVEKQVKEFRKYCEIGPAKAKVENVKRKNWQKPIKSGFEII